jgi:two-component system chemotaxis sensor kinase CheA
MALDLEMAEIAKIFFEESREGLDAMEAGLLKLDASTGRENIDMIFRAAHSIKGGSATFGFVDIAEFTHGVETLLDEMRQGSRPVTSDAVQVLLRSCDCLRAMVAATQEERPMDQARVASLNADIKHILSGHAPAHAAPSEVAPRSESARLGAATPASPDGWRIEFQPVAELLRLRNEPTRMFAELERLGPLVVRADVSRLPALSELDPELCYLSWGLELFGQIVKSQLEEVFDWVDAGCRLEFIPMAGQAASAAPPAPAQTQQDTAPAGEAPTAAAPAVASAAAAATAAPAAAPAAAAPQKAAVESGSIRVATEKVDDIINLVGELVITQSMLSSFADGIDAGDLDRLRQGLSLLARNTRELQESVMQIRMLPISFAFNRFPRIVHDLSRKLGKKIELKFSGEGTELDKTVLEKISDPLVHLVRNALDHGLETPEVRLAAGKTETGCLELSAFHEGGCIIIEVKDDGAGINRAKVLEKARERALIPPDHVPTHEQIDNLIFMPGFSTAEQVTDVSGRGVGMDVVRRNINDLGGHVQIFSEERRGSTIRIRLPLTLAILDGQLVRVGKEIYVISLLAITETIQISADRLNVLAGQTEVFRLRDEYLPVIKLGEQFGIESDNKLAAGGLLVVVEADDRRIGVLVDDLLAQQQVVVKSLESNYKSVLGIAGATILGDGTVALIIDASGLIRSVAAPRRGAAPARAA